MPRIAIIGAGIAGLRLAQRLAAIAEVDVFEKSKGFGGRMSRRRTPEFQFDHGAQFFTARSQGFQDFLSPYRDSGVVVGWSPKVVEISGGQHIPLQWTEPRFVATPGMTELCKAMAQAINVTRSARVAALTRKGPVWTLTFDNDTEAKDYDWVFSTAPAEQSAKLLPELTEWDTIKMQGCYSLMLGFDDPMNLPYDAAVIRDTPLAWISVNTNKPGRAGGYAILCQSDNGWADERMEADQTLIKMELSKAFEDITGIQVAKTSYTSLHRWRFAKAVRSAATPYLLDDHMQCGAAGDWCGEGRVESAFESAEALADAVIAQISAKAA